MGGKINIFISLDLIIIQNRVIILATGYLKRVHKKLVFYTTKEKHEQ